MWHAGHTAWRGRVGPATVFRALMAEGGHLGGPAELGQ